MQFCLLSYENKNEDFVQYNTMKLLKQAIMDRFSWKDAANISQNYL